MDIQLLTRTNYRVSVLVAVVLSGMVVTITAFLGRGALNLRGALVLSEPTDVTVIALVEPRINDSVRVSAIDLLRREEHEGEVKPFYAYHVQTSDGENYLVRINFSTEENMWQLLQFEHLRPTTPTNDIEGA